MKKMNNTRKAMKVSAVLASVLMAASSTGMVITNGMAVSAEGAASAVSSVKKTTSSVPAGAASISLVGKSAKPDETIDVQMTVDANNECTCYDVLIEYDARLELEDIEGAKATCDFEENGRKFVSLVSFESKPYKDGAVANLKFHIPKGAENDNYIVKFDQVKVFSDNNADFVDYKVNDTVVTVTGGVAKKGTNLELKNVTGIAGENAVVQIIPTTGNRCACYDMLVEYDSRLLLEDCDVALANSFDIFERDGKSYVALVGYTKDVYNDGEPMVALNFHLPYNAKPSDTYVVRFAEVKSFASSYENFDKFSTTDGVISVFDIDPADAAPAANGARGAVLPKVKVFQKFTRSGELIGTEVGYRGDSNRDGKTNVRDAAAIAQMLAGKGRAILDTEMFEFFGDVDDNGKINVRDAAKIAKYVANGSVAWK